MIAAKVEKIGSRDLDKIGERRLAAKGCLWSSHGGFKKPFVPKAIGAAKSYEHLAVDLAHDRDRKMDTVGRRCLHASRRSVLR